MLVTAQPALILISDIIDLMQSSKIVFHYSLDYLI